MQKSKMAIAEMVHRILAYFYLFLSIISHYDTSAKYIEGSLSTKEDWYFLARFCFLSNRGRLQFQFTYPKELFSPQNILLYYDEADQWPAVYKSKLNCTSREKKLRPENNQVITLTTAHTWSGCSESTISDGVTLLNCTAGRSFRSARERWWFLAVSHCGGPGLKLNYKLWMTNGDQDDFFFRHFSADEFYILQTNIAFIVQFTLIFILAIYVANILQVDIAFLMVFIVMLIVSVMCGVVLKNRQLFHSTYKMYMISLGCEVIHLLIMCIAYGSYANDGVEKKGLKVFGRLFESASFLVFLLMLILLGKGYTITRGRLSNGGSIKIAVFMTLYVICYAVLFIYEANFFDPGEVLYRYESPPGYGLIAIQILAWIWFCYAIFFTLKHYPEKSQFYYPFFVFYTIWFWAGPMTIFIAMDHTRPWVREKVVNGISIVLSFVAYTGFLVLTRPTAANKNFPYHVRTSQIGIMTGPPTTQNGAPSGVTNGGFAPPGEGGVYAVSPPSYYDATGPNFTELFTVSNSRSNPGIMDPNANPNWTKKEGEANGGLPPPQATADPFIVAR